MAKRILVIIGCVVVAVIVMVAVLSQMQEAAVKRAQAPEELAASSARLQQRLKDAKVRLVRTAVGDIAADTLAACYSKGYPENVSSLSKERLAECKRLDGLLSQIKQIIPFGASPVRSRGWRRAHLRKPSPKMA